MAATACWRILLLARGVAISGQRLATTSPKVSACAEQLSPTAEGMKAGCNYINYERFQGIGVDINRYNVLRPLCEDNKILPHIQDGYDLKTRRNNSPKTSKANVNAFILQNHFWIEWPRIAEVLCSCVSKYWVGFGSRRSRMLRHALISLQLFFLGSFWLKIKIFLLNSIHFYRICALSKLLCQCKTMQRP